MHHGYCKHPFLHLLHLLLIGVALTPSASGGGSFGLKLIHKYSDEAKMHMMQKYGGNFDSWPSLGSMESYHILHEQDKTRHERVLSTYSSLIFAPGNATAQLIGTFGTIFYTLVELGTPNKTFLVALDTGSDLFWVPCDCKQCAPLAAPGYQDLVPLLNTYSPTASTTSKQVSCSDSLCDLSSNCAKATDPCPYLIQYASPNTSSSGTLVTDVMSFTTDNVPASPTSVPVVFGCGNVQTGSFLEGGSPDGLLGLGLGAISLPSILAKDGLVQNSFSMCFGYDNSGTIFFGDKGAPTQQTTSFVAVNGSSSLYGIQVDQILLDGEIVTALPDPAIFDTGTTLTYLTPAAYRAVTTAFASQAKLQRVSSATLSIPFELCYATSDPSTVSIPQISLALHGGGNFTAQIPYLFLIDSTTNQVGGFCLAILSASSSIIGQNFMLGYSIVFDRQDMQLGWQLADCDQDIPPNTTIISPAPLSGPSLSPATPPSASSPKSRAPSSAPSLSTPTSSPSSSQSPSVPPSSTSPTSRQQPPPPVAEKPSFGERLEPHTFLASAFLGLILLTFEMYTF